MNVCQGGYRPYLIKLFIFAIIRQMILELGREIKIVLDRSLAPPGDNNESSIPEETASSTTNCMTGLSTIGSISFGCTFVAGRNRVPNPAAGITAFLIMLLFFFGGGRYNSDRLRAEHLARRVNVARYDLIFPL